MRSSGHFCHFFCLGTTVDSFFTSTNLIDFPFYLYYFYLFFFFRASGGEVTWGCTCATIAYGMMDTFADSSTTMISFDKFGDDGGDPATTNGGTNTNILLSNILHACHCLLYYKNLLWSHMRFLH